MKRDFMAEKFAREACFVGTCQLVGSEILPSKNSIDQTLDAGG
jgi:hypothetical protein